jgi:hypothetical protein
MLLGTLLLLLSACSSKPLVREKSIEAVSNQAVTVQAREDADSYRWSQLSGIPVTLIGADTAILKFTAPAVTKEERLVFALEAGFAGLIRTTQVTVIVSPAAKSSDSNGSTGDTDDSGTPRNSDNNTTNNNDANTTTTNTPVLTKLTIKTDTVSLNKDHNTTLSVTARYDDNTTQDVTDKVQWQITPPDAVRISGHTLTALRDLNVTLRATSGSLLSNPVTLSIYWEVNGHRLPPEPDPKVNNATLLGVDVNHNGVRDDVERWIYRKYKDKHPIYIDIAMQAARGYKLVLEHPEKAREIRKVVNSSNVCNWYYQGYAELFGEDLLVHERIDAKVFSIYFNTKKRIDTYWQYDKLLSGGVYDTPDIENMKSNCDFNTSKYSE